MTCPFYVAGRHPCALGEPDGRHCGPRQYPVGPCNLDEIGRGEAWRAVVGMVVGRVALIAGNPHRHPNGRTTWYGSLPIEESLDAVGWSP